MFSRLLKTNHLNILSTQIIQFKHRKTVNMSYVSGDNFIKINVETNNGNFIELKGEYNDTLYDIAKRNNTIESQILNQCLDCECQGVMACAGCHVYIDDDWYNSVNKPCENEQDTLDLLTNSQDNSKLGCQLRLKPHLNGIKIKLPVNTDKLF